MLNILPIYLCKCSSGFIVINDLCGSTQCLDANGLVCGGDASLCNVASGTCGDSPVVKSSSNLGLIIGIIAGLLLLLLLCLLITYLEEEIEVKEKTLDLMRVVIQDNFKKLLELTKTP